MTADRSAGVQQGRRAYVICDGHAYPLAVALDVDSARQARDGRREERPDVGWIEVDVVEAVSPEPREPWTEDDLTSEEDAERSTHSRSKSEELKARSETLARERCPSLAPLAAGGPLRCELTVGHKCEHYNAASGYWSDREAEPRGSLPLPEGWKERQEARERKWLREHGYRPGLPPDPSVAREPYLVGCPVDRCVLEEGHAGRHCMGSGEEFTVHEGVIVAVDRGPEPKAEANRELSRDDETNSTTTTSVASVLRLTASRLRDSEYHWYEHAAVTLERLAEKLEKGREG